MSYCSRSDRRRFTVLDFKSWAYSRICCHFRNICTAHAQKRLFMNFRCKFRHRRSIRRTRFPVRVQNFGNLATFSIDFFLHFICWMFAIFLLLVCLTYWSRKYTTRVDPHVDNSHLVWSCDLVTLTFDLLALSSWRAWRVMGDQPCHKVWRP